MKSEISGFSALRTEQLTKNKKRKTPNAKRQTQDNEP